MKGDIDDGNGRHPLARSSSARGVLLLSAFLTLVSCRDGATSPIPPAPPTPAMIGLEPGTVQLEVGDTVRIRASVLDAGGQAIADAAVT